MLGLYKFTASHAVLNKILKPRKYKEIAVIADKANFFINHPFLCATADVI